MKSKLIIGVSGLAVVAMALLASNINEKKQEQIELSKTPTITNPATNENWSRYYPRQFDSWKASKENGTIDDMLKKNPQLAILWAGYGFAKDYNSPRGHYYAAQSVTNSLRTGAPKDDQTGPMPTACWTCKSPDVPRLIKDEGELEYFTGKWAKYGGEVVNQIGCADCHDPETSELALGRPYVDRGLEAAGMKTFADSSHQEKRSLVCAQCHSEYYFKKTKWTDDAGNDKTAVVVTFPWGKGLSAENMEEYYDNLSFKDWTHKISKAPMLKAQHPGYEIAQTGIHAQNGVSCADCHMPYTQEGSVKYTNHHVGNPLDNVQQSCMQCHRESEKKLVNLVATKYERKDYLMQMTMDNLAKSHLEAGKAWQLGADEAEMQPVLTLIRHAQWRWDYSIASHGSFFHAPEETLKLLSSANEKAMQSRLELRQILAKYGEANYAAPDFSSKEKAQALASVPLAKLVGDKMEFKEGLEKEWEKEAVQKGRIKQQVLDEVDQESSYFKK